MIDHLPSKNVKAIALDQRSLVAVGPMSMLKSVYTNFLIVQVNVKIGVTAVNNSCFSPYSRCLVNASSYSSVGGQVLVTLSNIHRFKKNPLADSS